MICAMKDSDAPCGCKHKPHQPAKVLSYARESSECCSEGTVELANSNLLSTVKTELPVDITSFTPAVSNIENDLSLTSNNNFLYISLVEHVPKDDIPILISSLLI